jgi:hypothetical protein
MRGAGKPYRGPEHVVQSVPACTCILPSLTLLNMLPHSATSADEITVPAKSRMQKDPGPGEAPKRYRTLALSPAKGNRRLVEVLKSPQSTSKFQVSENS